jgi:hypothetical protein
MPSLFRKSTPSAYQQAPDWATTLGTIGRVLDKSGLDLRDVALSLVGAEVWVCGAVWWSERVQSGWTTVTLRLDGDSLAPVGSSSMPKRSPSGHTGRAGWEARLTAIGILLDRLGYPVRFPTILQVDDGFAVTVQTIGTPTAPDPGLISRGFTAAQLAAAHPTAIRLGGLQ